MNTYGQHSSSLLLTVSSSNFKVAGICNIFMVMSSYCKYYQFRLAIQMPWGITAYDSKDVRGDVDLPGVKTFSKCLIVLEASFRSIATAPCVS